MTKNNRVFGRDRRRKHIRKTISGSPVCPRMSIFRSAKHIYAQLVDDETGTTLAAASSRTPDLAASLKEAKSPIERAAMVGECLAAKASDCKIERCVFDRAGYKYWGRVKAVAEGARKGGLKF
jgi:large subunit ribosomal protein L18